MKRLLKMLLILFFMYLLIQLSFKFFGKGHQLNYQIKIDEKTFEIEENYISNIKNEIDSYHFDIFYNDNVFSFQTYVNFNKSDTLIKEIKYFENENYICVLPIFIKKGIIIDFLCKSKEKTVYYQTIMGEDKELDDYVASIKEYDFKKWEDNKKEETKIGPVKIYKNNIVDNHFVGVNNYKGVYILDNLSQKKVVDIKIFNDDIYVRNLETLVNNFYVVANYNSEYEFSSFFIIDLITHEKKTIKTNKKISFDSYIQGVVNNNVYIYDQDNKKQYEINVKTRSILEIGNAETGIKNYDNGTWKRLDISELAKEKVIFDNKEIIIEKDSIYSKIDIIGYKESGYIYYYKKVSNGYEVYRSTRKNSEQKIYLFKINDLKNIKYIYDFVYYIDGNEVKYYNDNMGIRTIFINEEFDFNENLRYIVYFRK